MGKAHEQLEVWKVAMQLVKSVYELTAGFPGEERFGLIEQMRRAAVSTSSNLAERAGRNHAKEKPQFIGISRGSLADLETQLQLAVMLNFAPKDHIAFELADRAGKLLTGLHEKWRMK